VQSDVPNASIGGVGSFWCFARYLWAFFRVNNAPGYGIW
jgi:hypothetical protein